MQFIVGCFWDRDERRLRAFWRLIVQLLIFVPLAVVMSLVIGVLSLGWLVAVEGLAVREVAGVEMVQVLMGSPAFQVANHLIVGLAMTGSIWLAGRWVDRRRFAGFGLHPDRTWWGDFGFGLLLGALLMGVIFLFQLAVGWVRVTGTWVVYRPDVSFVPAFLAPLISYVLVGFYEELFSRGYQLKNLAEGLRFLGPRGAVLAATLLSSAVFGVLHAANPNATLLSTLNLVVAGFFLASGYVLTGELAIPIGLHISWNLVQGNVFGFPVSGTGARAATVIAIRQQGPLVWTGGPFGPEGGLLGLGIMLVGIALTVAWVRWRRGSVGLHVQLADRPVREGRWAGDEPWHPASAAL